ncbi:MAG: type II toxin-antitoxin system HicB family antitoxin [Actinomycetota bacterium]|nr:type II toxin-antitoxin system HicB family antitoxin [Actinomycetota bacterium]MDP2288899.1 type II toxin-antitoxin system HicB family antitoxin [Actinomycetota bacterium]
MTTKSKAKAAPQADHYTYRLGWSVKDNDFIATVVEFPSLSWIAETREAALAGLTSVVEEVLQDMLAQDEQIPAPWDERTFSGKFNLRLGADLHKRVALEAAERQESMNTYVVKKLGFVEA